MLENYFTSVYWSALKISDIREELLAPCGLYCGVCRIYKAYKDNDIEFKKEILPSFNDYGVKTIDDITCIGCLSDGVIFHICQKCPIKDCIKSKKIEGCHLCDNFPCDIIANWPDSFDKKVIIRPIHSR